MQRPDEGAKKAEEEAKRRQAEYQELARALPLENMAKAYFSVQYGDKEAAIKQFKEDLAKNPPIFNGKVAKVDIVAANGNNNLNVFITVDDRVPLVIQLGEKPEQVNTVIQRLSTGGTPPTWMATSYLQRDLDPASHAGLTPPVQRDPKKIEAAQQRAVLNPFPQRSLGSINVVDVLTPLTRAVDEKRGKVPASEQIDMLKGIGADISRVLSELSNNNLVWTDLKPENLLLRTDEQGNQKIVIADLKGFLPVDQIPVKPDVKEKHGNVKGLKTKNTKNTGMVIPSITNTTPGYISKGTRLNLNESQESRYSAIPIWEQEYSYQMAASLYNMATGALHLSPSGFSDPHPNFDFNTDKFPIFAGEAGQRFQSILQRLNHADPAQRMHHKDAAELLQYINDPVEYEKRNALLQPHMLAERMQQRINEVYEASCHQANARQVEPIAQQVKAHGGSDATVSSNLAARLYHVHTNPPPFLDPMMPKRNPPNVAIDPRHPAFSSPSGQRVISIIGRLGEEGPGRMHYQDAAKLLNVINNPVEYERVNKMVNDIRDAQKSIAEIAKNPQATYVASVTNEEYGKRLQSIIQRMKDPNPAARMTEQDALKLLRVIDNTVEYEKLNTKINKGIEAVKAMTPEAPERKSTHAMLLGAMQPGKKPGEIVTTQQQHSADKERLREKIEAEKKEQHRHSITKGSKNSEIKKVKEPEPSGPRVKHN